jgi:hypothetical protein
MSSTDRYYFCLKRVPDCTCNTVVELHVYEEVEILLMDKTICDQTTSGRQDEERTRSKIIETQVVI